MLLTVIFLIVSLLSLVTGSCPCGGDPNTDDLSSSLLDVKIESVVNGMRRKSTSQCHYVKKMNGGYDPNLDKPILHSQGNGYRMYRIFQPHYYNGECYNNSLFCAYNVQCSPEQILYYHFSDHDIEDPLSSGTCLDALSINRHSFPNHRLTSCGRVGINGATYAKYNVIQSAYDIDSMSIVFRSNSGCSATGYFLWVSCIDFDHLEAKQKRQAQDNSITVPFKGYLLYRRSQYTLYVMDHKFKTLRTLRNIRSLTVQHEGSKNKIMHRSATPLRGEGRLGVRCYYNRCMAHYMFIGVPYEHRLTTNEQLDVMNLLSGCVRKFQGRGDYTANETLSVKNETVNNIEAAHINRTATETLEQSSTVLQPTNTPPPNCIPPPTYTALKALAFKFSRSKKAILQSVGKFYLQEPK